MSSSELHDFIERISNLLRNETRSAGAAYGLQPVQLEALGYLNTCNRYSDTPQGVSDYLGLTKGTVSQSLKILASKGFITKSPDAKDKRVVHLKLTKPGKALIEKLSPSPLLTDTYNQLSHSSKSQLNQTLQMFLGTLQRSNKLRSFGVCHSCRHHQQTRQQHYFCALTQEKLSEEEIHTICREHEYKV